MNEKIRTECIMASMADKGWDYDKAEEELENSIERTGITYKDYKKYKFWKLNAFDQFDAYDKIIEKRNIRKERVVNNKPTIVVLASVNSYGLSSVRSVGSCGYIVDLIANVVSKDYSEVMRSSKYNRIAVEIVSDRTNDGINEDVISELMEYYESGKDRLILYPADVYASAIVSANSKILSKAFIIPGSNDDEEADNDITDIAYQNKIAAEAGLQVKREFIIPLNEEIENIPEMITYPCVCDSSIKMQGIKPERKLCSNEKELLDHIDYLRDKEPHRSALIREYIRADHNIEVSGVCFDQKVIIPACVKVERVKKDSSCRAERNTLISIKESGLSRRCIEKMMRKLHYTGPFTAVFSYAGGSISFRKIRFCINNERLYLKSGVNLPEIYIKGTLGQHIYRKDYKIRQFGQTLINEQSVWNDYRRGHIKRDEYRAIVDSADIRVFESSDDPLPYEVLNDRLHDRSARNKKKINKRLKSFFLKKSRKEIRKILNKNAFPYNYLGDLYMIIRGYPQGRRKNRRDIYTGRDRVLVAGRNWGSNLCMAKSVGEAGYDVEVLHIYPKRPKKNNLQKWLKPEKYSRYVKAYYALDAKKTERRIVERLLKIADNDKKMLLIPADDLVAGTIDEYYYDLKDHFIMPTVNGKGGELSKLMSKETQKELAKAAGLPVLNSCVIKSDGEIHIPETVKYPCFIKPDISKNGVKTLMKKCDSEEELLAVLNSRKSQGFEMLVEDYADVEREMSFLGLSTTEGVVCPGYFEAVIEGKGSHRGVALLGRLLPAYTAEPLISKVIDFIGSLKYNGLFDVDLIETKDGTVYFVELNLRYGGSGFALTKAGINLPGMYCDYMLKGKPIDMDCSLGDAGQTFVNEKGLIDGFREGFIELDEIDKIAEKADIRFIEDASDIAPFRHFRRHYRTARKLRANTEKRRSEREKDREIIEKQANEEYLRRKDIKK